MMNKIEFVQDCKASEDGVTVRVFKCGDVVDVAEDFAKICLDAGYAKPFKHTRTNPPKKTYKRRKK